MQPEIQYAKSGNVHIAYQVFGEGDVDLVFVPGFISHIDNYWDEPGFARWLRRLGSFCRVVMFDKRGTGFSDHVTELPGMDRRMDDIRSVMDAVGLDRAAIFGISEGGSLATLFAASHPERSTSLIVYGGFARSTSWFPTQEALNELFDYIDSNWGSGRSIPFFAPSKGDDSAFQQWWGKFERLGANSAAAKTLMRMNSEIDRTGILSSMSVPTLIIHRTDDVTVDCDGGRSLAERIPNARYAELSGVDHLPWVGNADEVLDHMERFLTGELSAPDVERVLATVVFTDIVDSTAKAQAMGDQAWADLQELHDKGLRRELARFQGREIRWTGDGFHYIDRDPARGM